MHVRMLCFASVSYVKGALVCINPSNKSIENSLSSMSFAIKTGSISKRKLKHYYSHRATTPSKKSDYLKVMEKKL